MASLPQSFILLPIIEPMAALVSAAQRKLNTYTLDTINTFHFDVVQGCQLRCVGCPNSVLLPKIDHISPDDFDHCLRNVDVRLVRTLRLFNFGEPFLHPDIGGLLGVIRRQAWNVERVEVSTNAMIYDERKLTEIIGSGVVTHLFVSCDGDGSPAEFERLRPPARWDKLLTFLEGAARIRSELQSSIVLATRSVCESPEGRDRWSQVLRPRGWEPEFQDWQILPNTSGEPWQRQARVTNTVCWPMSGVNLFVDCRGDVIPCCSYPNLPPMGNLKTQRFSEVHRGELRRRMLHLLETKRTSDSVCGQCEA